ncbi:MAG: hypothetical protein M4579_002847 [Chaenotheca gracillima]|nr:MAG: hypothetical protein M4579_002847 [Chaenotheca gracillima]
MSASVATALPEVVRTEDTNGVDESTNAYHETLNQLTGSPQTGEDPFATTPSQSNHHSQRFSRMDSQLFDLDESSSPSHIKHALEAYLTETDRRIQDTSKLGTSLVQQRKDLAERLKDVEGRQGETEVSPELRQKLLEIEKEYNEVGRESARASLGPKQWRTSVDGPIGQAPSDDVQRSVSPSILSSQANYSPSKVNAPSRKNRNQPSGRVHDIEFATEISTSLLSQVRNLQAILAEREDTIKNADRERSRLEVEAEGHVQRLRALDESEQRYKDENWALETHKHELMGAAAEAADREQKLNQGLSAINAEKAAAQKELDELKQAHGKLADDSSQLQKQNEGELLALRRGLATGDSDKISLQRKVEELTSQNQELAKAVAGQFKRDQDVTSTENPDEDIDMGADLSTPENSPPPSPTKGTPRHSMLESETLKSSLHHAHRMIQNLKTNIHREKTEKVDLKRMLQEARDELELRRSDSGLGAGSAGKRRKTGAEKDTFKKPPKPNMLGAGRNSKNEVFLDEADWEDHAGDNSPSRAAASRQIATGGITTDASDAFETAAESSDAFETANETEGPAETQTSDGADGESSEETETEAGPTRGGTVRTKQQSNLSKPGNRTSYMSTASTSADDDEELRPSNAPQQRFRLKTTRGGTFRRSKVGPDSTPVNSNPGSLRDSPASVISNQSQTGPRPQSLYAELGGLEGSEDEDEEEVADGTPSRRSVLSLTPGSSARPLTATTSSATKQASLTPPPARPQMVDSSTMTETVEPVTPPLPTRKSPFADGLAAGVVALAAQKSSDPLASIESPQTATNSGRELDSSVIESTPSRSVDRSSEGPMLGLTPDTRSTPQKSLPTDPSFDVVERPRETPQPERSPAPMAFSSIQSQATEPIEARPITPATPDRQAKRMGGVFYSSPEPSETGTKDIDDSNVNVDASKPGFFGTLFGRKPSVVHAPVPKIAEDENTPEVHPDVPVSAQPEKQPFKDISNNIGRREPAKNMIPAPLEISKSEMADQGSQTLLSSEQIDNLLKTKEKPATPTIFADAIRAMPTSPTRSPVGANMAGSSRATRSVDNLPAAKPRNRTSDLGSIRDDGVSPRSPRRPGSSSSVRSSFASHPPLPPDHKQAIAAASQRVSIEPQSGQMGPPLIPASAYRSGSAQHRPRTPTNQYPQNQYPSSVASRSGATPRARGRSDVSSPIGTRRSSFSSFASELDERFNIQTDGMPIPMPQGLEGYGTDPRMIQAITQTMIGEYLWKYTRKAGRGQMSDKRHRRFFWVHPYTRTLYWSDKDPATAGRAELKAKSVAIEAVSVVSDDNPMPPGLHRKSLVVITPGRSVKFTATTGQRHETWFNALSYLLLRTGAEAGMNGHQDADRAVQHITSEDVDEFNPTLAHRSAGGGTGASNTAPSLSSYHSRTTRNDSPSRNASALSHRSRLDTTTPTLARPTSSNSRNNNSNNQRSISRLSNMFRNPRPSSTFRGSFSSRRSRQSLPGDASIYNASEVHDSAEDLREVMERQEEEADRLENVRACCDGKHDVSHLSRNSRHGSTGNRYSQVPRLHPNHQHQVSRESQHQSPRIGEAVEA